jgi:predicted dehydrogenase
MEVSKGVFMSIFCIRSGDGTVAPLHEEKGIKAMGIIDTDPTKKENVLKRGVQWFASYEEAAAQKPRFWDICTPPETHLGVMQKIIELDPNANIIVEKPICLSSQIPALQELLKGFQGKIVVNENYLSSDVTQTVMQVAFDKLRIKPRKIVVEMDKNRIADVKKGRYVDPEGAFKYEGTHMLTILQSILERLSLELPLKPETVVYEPMHVGEKLLEKQGSAEIVFKVGDVSVHLFSSMKGDIRHAYPPYGRGTIHESETAVRYRAVAIEGDEYTVVGFYEPLPNHLRSVGQVFVLKNKEVVEKVGDIADDTMGKHLTKAADYLLNKTDTNPCPAATGIEIVKLLDRVL